jgi:hypothetical protein
MAQSVLFLVAASLLVLAVSALAAPAMRLAIRANGIVQEGKPVNLEAMLDFQGQQPDAAIHIDSWHWDLDADQVFGEQGSEAQRGAEQGRFVTLLPSQLAGASSIVVHARVTLRVGDDEQVVVLEADNELVIGNVRPEVVVDSSFDAVGSSAQVSATCVDPGDDHTTVEWDLDMDGVFGERGHDALAGDELGSSVRFASFVDASEDRSVRVRVQCRDAEGAASKIQSAVVHVAKLQRPCNCGLPAPVAFKNFHLLESAHFDKKNHNKVVLTSSERSAGVVFHPTAVALDQGGVEVCARYVITNALRIDKSVNLSLSCSLSCSLSLALSRSISHEMHNGSSVGSTVQHEH